MSEIDKTGGSRDLLLFTAERLFAEHGLDAVSTRQIARAAGQSNTSAVHYWFGSRAALLEAILERRMSAVNSERLGLIDAFARSGQPASLRNVVAIYVRPLAAQLSQDTAYIRFTAQAYASREIDISALAAGKWDQSLRAVARMMRDRLPRLPRLILRSRVAFLFRQVVYALADWERNHLAGQTGAAELPLEPYVENLIDMMTAILEAPVTEKAAVNRG